MKQLVAQQLSEGTTVVDPSRRAADHALAINPWLGGTGTGACMYVKFDAIAFTSKHRLRRPPDSSH